MVPHRLSTVAFAGLQPRNCNLWLWQPLLLSWTSMSMLHHSWTLSHSEPLAVPPPAIDLVALALHCGILAHGLLIGVDFGVSARRPLVVRPTTMLPLLSASSPTSGLISIHPRAGQAIKFAPPGSPMFTFGLMHAVYLLLLFAEFA